MRIGFIGAGKVGFTLGKYFSVHGEGVAGYYSRSISSAAEAAQFTKTKAFPSMEELADVCDVLFLTVPDSGITAIYNQLSHDPSLIKGKMICHCSGAMTAEDAFPGIREKGALGYSVHPLFAVSDKFHAYEELTDVFFALEGDEERLEEMRQMLAGMGLHVQIIDPAGKIRYHCAASIASNLVVALMQESVNLLVSCGFSGQNALKALAPLAEGNMHHIVTDGPVRSLTGPVERGDAGTVRKHINCLQTEEEREIYCLLSERLADIAQRKHPERSYDEVRKAMERKGKKGTPEEGRGKDQ